MKLFKIEEYIKMKNPTPGNSYRPEILTDEHNAKGLGGMFGLLDPGNQVPYHYHENRESILVIISGEAIEVIEGEEIPIKEMYSKMMTGNCPPAFSLILRKK